MTEPRIARVPYTGTSVPDNPEWRDGDPAAEGIHQPSPITHLKNHLLIEQTLYRGDQPRSSQKTFAIYFFAVLL